MKVTRQRRAISQSMDLFIIIAAVLGVGGIVTASIYNLVSAATSNSSISIVGASLKAGDSASASPVAISVSVKNTGGSPISCSAKTSCEVVFAGTSTGTGPARCESPCSITSGGNLTWALGTTAGPLTFRLGSPARLPAGSQTSLVLSGALTATAPAFWAAGSLVTIDVLLGSASAQVTVVSQ